MTWWLTQYDTWILQEHTNCLFGNESSPQVGKRSGTWCCFLVELLLSIPISNAKVEKMFSLMNRVDTDSRAALSEHTLDNLVRIQIEGLPLEEFDPTPAIQLWASSANRRVNQGARKQNNSSHSEKRPKVFD